MDCPECTERNHHVLYTRPYSICIMRRRECWDCGRRWSTYELAWKSLAKVAKLLGLPFTRAGSRKFYDR